MGLGQHLHEKHPNSWPRQVDLRCLYWLKNVLFCNWSLFLTQTIKRYRLFFLAGKTFYLLGDKISIHSILWQTFGFDLRVSFIFDKNGSFWQKCSWHKGEWLINSGRKGFSLNWDEKKRMLMLAQHEKERKLISAENVRSIEPRFYRFT